MAWWGSGVGVRSQGGGPALPGRALWWAWPGCLLLASLHTRRLSQGPKCTRPAQCLGRLLPPASTDPPAVNFITLKSQISHLSFRPSSVPAHPVKPSPILVQAEQNWLSFTWGRSLPWPLPQGSCGDGASDSQAGAGTLLHALGLQEAVTTLLALGILAPCQGGHRVGDGVRVTSGLVAHRVVHRLQDAPHVLLRHSQAQFLLGFPQGCVHHVLVSRVTLAAWETEQAQGVRFLCSGGQGGVGEWAVTEG